MFCVKCGASFPKGNNFCPNCGQLATRTTAAAAASVSTTATGPKKKGHPFLTFCLVVMVIVIAIGSFAIGESFNKVQNDILIWLISVFEVIVLFVLVLTIIPLIFLCFKKYVLSKLRRPRASQRKFLSALSGKFFRRK